VRRKGDIKGLTSLMNAIYVADMEIEELASNI